MSEPKVEEVTPVWSSVEELKKRLASAHQQRQQYLMVEAQAHDDACACQGVINELNRMIGQELARTKNDSKENK